MTLPDPIPSLLIVDDDDELRRQLHRAFERRGFDVRTCSSYDEAMECAAEEAPEYAIVDLRLGTDRGLDVVRDLLRVEPTTRIVMLTGYGSIATAVRAVRLGAVDYLSKPADADQILAALEQRRGDAAPGDEGAPSTDAPRAATLAEAEWEHIQRVLTECDGNVSRAAEVLGIHRRSLQRKLARRPTP